jgi:hypothetical protein
MTCAGEFQVMVNNTYVGYGNTKDEALANLLDRIAEGGEATLGCRQRKCDGGDVCEPSVDLEDVENGRVVRYGRSGGRWKAFLFGRNQPALSALIPAYCSCAPPAEDDKGAVFHKLASTPGAISLRVGGARVDIDDHIPGERCVEGQVTGTARNIPPVTNPNKAAAEKAVLDAGRAAAIADAQSKCNEGKCTDKNANCTLVKILEATNILSTPSRDPNGAIIWTCHLISFDVLGVCVCQNGGGEKEQGSQWQTGTSRKY